MAISGNLYDSWLREFAESGMGEEKKQELAGRIMEFHEKKVQDALALMMDNLYSHDYAELKHDLVKIILLDEEREPAPEERAELLRVLWWCIKVFFHDDCSLILDECEKMIDSYVESGDYDYKELPFV